MTADPLIDGTYLLNRIIGRGAMGVVWAATNVKFDKPVAIKLIRNADDPTVRERLLREARACARIDHPNVIQVFDTGETAEGDPFLVMQLLEGDSLSSSIKKPMAIEEAIRIARDVARGLGAAHAVGVVHRDLKPANVFLHRGGGSQPEVKLLDFGISRIAHEVSRTQAGSAVGTPAYMSPEQARAKDVDHRADIWGFGVLLYRLLSGELPFKGNLPLEYLAAITSRPIPSLPPVRPDIDAEVSDLVARCLVRDPDKRIQTMAECEQILSRLYERAMRASVAEMWQGRMVNARDSKGDPPSSSASLRAATSSVLAAMASSRQLRPGDAEDAKATVVPPRGETSTDGAGSSSTGAAIRSTATITAVVTGAGAGLASADNHAASVASTPSRARRDPRTLRGIAVVGAVALAVVGLAFLIRGSGDTSVRATGGTSRALVPAAPSAESAASALLPTVASASPSASAAKAAASTTPSATPSVYGKLPSTKYVPPTL